MERVESKQKEYRQICDEFGRASTSLTARKNAYTKLCRDNERLNGELAQFFRDKARAESKLNELSSTVSDKSTLEAVTQYNGSLRLQIEELEAAIEEDCFQWLQGMGARWEKRVPLKEWQKKPQEELNRKQGELAELERKLQAQNDFNAREEIVIRELEDEIRRKEQTVETLKHDVNATTRRVEELKHELETKKRMQRQRLDFTNPHTRQENLRKAIQHEVRESESLADLIKQIKTELQKIEIRGDRVILPIEVAKTAK